MIKMNLSIQPAAPALVPTAQAPATAAAQPAQVTDFMLMLGQLVAAAAPRPAPALATGTVPQLPADPALAAATTGIAPIATALPAVNGAALLPVQDEPPSKEEDPEELLALFSTAIPTAPALPVPVEAAVKEDPEDLLAMLSMSLPPAPPLHIEAAAKEASAGLPAMFSMTLPPIPPLDSAAPAAVPPATPTATATEQAVQALSTMRPVGVVAAETAAVDMVGAQSFTQVVQEIAVTASEAPQRMESFQISTGPVELQQHTRPMQVHSAIARPVHTPVGGAAWADEIGSRVVMMAESGNHTASLRLSPDHLGPLEISIVMRDDKASVWFGAAHADTRAAIETALPRLRDMFEAQGLSLADAGVFREPPRERALSQAGGTATEPALVEDAVTESIQRVRIGLVDAYA